MKRCPTCHRDYYDPELRFCLDDGSALLDGPVSFNDAPTMAIPTVKAFTLAQPFSGNADNDALTISMAGHQLNSIAVLPFTHLSSDVDDEYFCDGLAEELINALSRVDELKVVARTSAFSFKGKDVDISKIGSILNVNNVVEGSVRKSGGRMRINVQLIDAANGFNVWSERYDAELDDVFAIQDKIAASVVAALKIKLLGKSEESVKLEGLIAELKHHVSNVDAYQIYLRGRFYLNKFTTVDAFKAVDLFRDAIEKDPTLATAHAGLADAYIILTEMGPLSPIDAMPKAKASAMRALEIDESLAEAHSALGRVLQVYEFDFREAESRFRLAIRLSPNNPLPRASYGMLLAELERHDEADRQFKKLLEVDPLSVVNNWLYSFCLFLARRYDDCLQRAKTTLELDPNFGMAFLSIAFANQMKGEYASSVEAYARSSEVMGSPENAVFIRESFRDGWEGFLRAITSTASGSSFSSYIIAVFHAALGKKDAAFTELFNALDKRESYIVMVKSDPRFDSLRNDPRYFELIKKIGFLT